MIVLLGDSHIRSYKLARLVGTRIFLAQGRKNNFSSFIKGMLTTLRYLKSAHRFKSWGWKLGFVVGEPDVRYLCYGKWDIGKTPEDILSSTYIHNLPSEYSSKVINRIHFFLKVITIFKLKPDVIVGAGSPNPEIKNECIKFNEALKFICDLNNVNFFDPQSNAIMNDVIKEKFIGYSVFQPSIRDHTHLSEAISKPFDQFLLKNICAEDKVQKLNSEKWKQEVNFDKYFSEINNFKTFKPNDGFLLKSAKKIRKFVKSLYSR